MITGAVVLGVGVFLGWLLTLITISMAHDNNKEN